MDPRGPIRVFTGVFAAALSLTIKFLAPGVPDELLISWVAVITSAEGVAEVIYDGRKFKQTKGTP